MKQYESTQRKLDGLITQFSDPEFPDDTVRLSGLKKALEDAILADNLMENDAIRQIIDGLLADVRSMTEILVVSRSDELPDKKRDNILDRRDLYKNFLSFFIDAKHAIADITKQVDDEARHFAANKGRYILPGRREIES